MPPPGGLGDLGEGSDLGGAVSSLDLAAEMAAAAAAIDCCCKRYEASVLVIVVFGGWPVIKNRKKVIMHMQLYCNFICNIRSSSYCIFKMEW